MTRSWLAEGADVARNNIVTALGVGFLTFILSTFDATALECPQGTHEGYDITGRADCYPDKETLKACQSWGKWSQTKLRCVDRPVKPIGKATTQEACEAQGHRWDQQAGRCIKFETWESKPDALKSALKKQCAAKGGRIDEQTGQCITSGGVGGE